MALHDGVQDHDQDGETQTDREVNDPPLVAVFRAELCLSSGSDSLELAGDAEGCRRDADIRTDSQFSDDLRMRPCQLHLVAKTSAAYVAVNRRPNVDFVVPYDAVDGHRYDRHQAPKDEEQRRCVACGPVPCRREEDEGYAEEVEDGEGGAEHGGFEQNRERKLRERALAQAVRNKDDENKGKKCLGIATHEGLQTAARLESIVPDA